MCFCLWTSKRCTTKCGRPSFFSLNDYIVYISIHFPSQCENTPKRTRVTLVVSHRENRRCVKCRRIGFFFGCWKAKSTSWNVCKWPISCRRFKGEKPHGREGAGGSKNPNKRIHGGWYIYRNYHGNLVDFL